MEELVVRPRSLPSPIQKIIEKMRRPISRAKDREMHWEIETLVTIVLACVAVLSFLGIASNSLASRPLAFGDVTPPFPTIADAIKGFFSYWNYQEGGVPLAPGVYALLLTIPTYILPGSLAQWIFVLLPMPIAASTFFLLAREWGATVRLSAEIASIFSVNVVTITYLISGSSFSTLMPLSLTPAVALYLTRYFTKKGQLLDLVLLAMIFALGTWWNPQFTFWMIPVVLACLAGLARLGHGRVIISRRGLSHLVLFVSLFGGLSLVSNFTYVALLNAYFGGGSVGNSLGPIALYAQQVTWNFRGQLQWWVLLADLAIISILALRYSYIEGTRTNRQLLPFLGAALLLVGFWLGGRIGYPTVVFQYVPLIPIFEPWSIQWIVIFFLCSSLLLMGIECSSPKSVIPSIKRGGTTNQVQNGRKRVRCSSVLQIALIAVTLTQLIVPMVVGDVVTGPIGGILLPGPNLAGAEIPASVPEFTHWIGDHESGDPISGVFWAPLDFYTYRTLEYYIPRHQILLPSGYRDEDFFIEPARTRTPNSTWTRNIATAGVRYTVVEKDLPGTASNLYGSAASFRDYYAGAIRGIIFGPQWNLVFFPAGSPESWITFYSSQPSLSLVYNSTRLAVFENRDYRGMVEAYSYDSDKFNASRIFQSTENLAVADSVTRTQNFITQDLTTPLLYASPNMIQNPSFGSNFSGWNVTESGTNASATSVGGSLRIMTSGAGRVVIDQTIPFPSNTSFVFHFLTASVGTNDSTMTVSFEGAKGQPLRNSVVASGNYGSTDRLVDFYVLDVSPLSANRLTVSISSAGSSPNDLIGEKILDGPSIREVKAALPLPFSYALRNNNDISLSGIQDSNVLIVFLTSFNKQWSLSSSCNSNPSTPFMLRSRTFNVFGSMTACGDSVLAFKGNITWQLVVNLWLGSLAFAGALLTMSIVECKMKQRKRRDDLYAT